MRVAVFGRVSQIWMTIDSPTPPPLSLLLLPEPIVVQLLFKDSSVVLLLLLTLATFFSASALNVRQLYRADSLLLQARLAKKSFHLATFFSI